MPAVIPDVPELRAEAHAFAKEYVARESDKIFNQIAQMADDAAKTTRCAKMTGPEALQLFANSLRRA